MLLSIPRETRAVAGLPENARVGASASQGGSLSRALAGDATRLGCSPCPCFAVAPSPAKSQPLVSEVPLKEEHLGQLLIILMG